jgi:hypothetical protein
MSKASLVLVLVAVACGGSTDIGEESGGGSSQGGSDAGKNSGGASSAGTAGKASGGTISNGGSISMGGRDNGGGTPGFGGTIVIGGYAGTGVAGTGFGGTGVVDPRCPDVLPNGACEDAGLMCQYDFNGCLCSTPQPIGYCPKVDPTCVGGPAAAPPPDPGAGGFTTKIAIAPPPRVCTCSAGMWACTYGF